MTVAAVTWSRTLQATQAIHVLSPALAKTSTITGNSSAINLPLRYLQTLLLQLALNRGGILVQMVEPFLTDGNARLLCFRRHLCRSQAYTPQWRVKIPL